MAKRIWGIGVLALTGCSGLNSGFVPPDPNSGEAPGTAGGGSVETSIGGVANAPFASQPPLPEAVFSSAQTPPPVSGGTLLLTKDQKTVVVSDPDRDQVLVVDVATLAVTRTLTLATGSEPGRAAQDALGQVHLVLRGSGKLLTFDPISGEVSGTRSVCSYPRGVAVSDAEHVVHVACAEGNLVSLSTQASEIAPVRNVKLDSDLRDVVVVSDGLWVSRFRSAEILRLDTAGKLLRRTTLPSSRSSLGESVSSVAWRMVPNANGGVVVVHQRAFAGEVVPSPGGYGSTGVPGGMVSSAISSVSDSGVALGSSVALFAPLPVDIAQSATTGEFLIASAALQHPLEPSFGRTSLLRTDDLHFSASPDGDLSFGIDLLTPSNGQQGQLVAVAFAGDVPVMQYREPSSLVIGSQGVSLPGTSVQDTGNMLFHLATSSSLSCASCHPEGQEDGHVWNFAGFGPRRTQSLRGGLLGTEPFHWDGAEPDFNALTHDVMQGRMGGPELSDAQNDALAGYIDLFPAMPATPGGDAAKIARGQTLFNDANVGCTTCHSGSRFSNDETVDVGSQDGMLQVPGLVGLWARAPYLHDGCAKTLTDRFTSCDTGKHGNLQGLSSDDLGALSVYLETL
jgi:hypothetical protein